MQNIEVEDIGTWPSQARKLLEDNVELLTLHAASEIAYPDNPLPKRLHTVNPYAAKREQVIEQLDQVLHGYNLVGYHCTRLLDAEIEDIKTKGLEPLSPQLFARRVKCATDNKAISNEVASYLLSNNLCSEECRQGTLWFVCGVSELRKECGVGKFFRGWGGEAIYNSHENDKHSWPTLVSIGQPCIVRTVLVPSKINFYFPNISMKLEAVFLQSCGVTTPHDPQFDANMRYQLPAEQVLKVITIDDPEFLKLTNYKNWVKRIN